MERPEIVVLTMNDRAQHPSTGFSDAQPGSIVVFEEPFFEEIREWEPGAELGVLRGTCIVGMDGTAQANLVFVFLPHEDEAASRADTISAAGSIAMGDTDAGARDIGEGALAVVGGTGKHRSRTGEVLVQVQNPHRWRIQG